MKIEYDNTADALYIRLKRGKVARTVKLKDRLIADIDAKDNVLGIEVLEASSQIPKGKLGTVEFSVPIAV